MAKANTLTGLIPTIHVAMDIVSREQVGLIRAVSRDASADGAAKNQIIRSPIVPTSTVTDITPAMTPTDSGEQEITHVDMSITKARKAEIKWNGEEQLALSHNGQQYNKIFADQLAQAMRTLSNEVEADLAGLFFGTSRAVGTAGTTPFGTPNDLSDTASLLETLENNGAPTSQLKLALGSSAIAALRGKQSNLFKVNEAGTDELLREGTLGRLQSFNIHNSYGIRSVKGSGASGFLTNGEFKEGDRFISVDTGSGQFKAGDVVTFKGDPNKYVVNVATASTITLAQPGLRQNIADNSEITALTGFTPNLGFDTNAFKLLARTPAMPKEGDSAEDVYTVIDPISGIPFQIALYKAYRQIKYEVGLAWGVAAIKPEHAVILLG